MDPHLQLGWLSIANLLSVLEQLDCQQMPFTSSLSGAHGGRVLLVVDVVLQPTVVHDLKEDTIKGVAAPSREIISVIVF